MYFCHPFLNGCDGFGCGCSSFCPFPDWIHPLLCNPTQFCCVGNDNGPTLVFHSILLEPCGNQSCTPRTFNIRVTGPSFPCGESFTLRRARLAEDTFYFEGEREGKSAFEAQLIFKHL